MNTRTQLPVGSVTPCVISKLLFCTLVLTGQAAAQADQGPPKLGATESQSGGSLVLAPPANVYVSVREPNGLPVTENATVKLTCPLAGISISGLTNDTAQAQFPNIPAGECTVEVSAPGYKPAHERTLVADSLKPDDQYVYVYLHPSSESAATWAHAQVSLHVLKEMDTGTEAMRKNRADEARKHFLKAEESAPQNPDVQYLLGLLESSLKDQGAASARFERAISLYPAHEHALVALGEIQLRKRNAREAAATLKKAVRANTMSYRAQLYLAAALLQQGDYTDAKPHAQKAVELAGDKIAMARTLLGEILAAEGNRGAARHEFELVVREYPKDPAATIAKNDLEDVDKGTDAAISRASAALSSTANESAADAELGTGPIRPWGPSDVDTIKPGVAGDVTCSAAYVVQRAGEASTEQLGNFEKFMASEHIEHEEIDRNGKPGAVRAHDFSYLVFAYRGRDGQTYLDESRDGGSGIESFPTSLATVGLAGLGAYIFRPGFASALDFTCEGLGQWRGKAAWLMYFRQKPDQRSNLHLWRTRNLRVEIPLKGRVWLAATTYQVLHLETDLREPMTELELTREHLSVDYGPVVFRNGQTELWVPWYADMFLERHHRRYHHRHTLSNYTLFAVDTQDTIGKPKGVERTGEVPEAP